MPTVIGINQVPPNIPRPNLWDYAGQATGHGLGKLEDAILAALTMGLYQGQRNIPNPSYGQAPGSPGSPGTSFQLAGQEANPLAPPMNPQVARGMYQAPQAAVQAPIFPTNQPKISLRDIQNAQAMQEMRKTQEALNPNSPERQLLQQKLEREKAYTGYLTSLSSPQAPPMPPGGGNGAGASPNRTLDFSSLTSPVIKKLAESGDADSLNKLRRLALELDDEEAIAALTALGEL